MLWYSCLSKEFVSYNGIKQGGVLSPILFCIYIDDLLVGLEKLGIVVLLINYFMVCLHMLMI